MSTNQEKRLSYSKSFQNERPTRRVQYSSFRVPNTKDRSSFWRQRSNEEKTAKTPTKPTNLDPQPGIKRENSFLKRVGSFRAGISRAFTKRDTEYGGALRSNSLEYLGEVTEEEYRKKISRISKKSTNTKTITKHPDERSGSFEFLNFADEFKTTARLNELKISAVEMRIDYESSSGTLGSSEHEIIERDKHDYLNFDYNDSVIRRSTLKSNINTTKRLSKSLDLLPQTKVSDETLLKPSALNKDYGLKLTNILMQQKQSSDDQAKKHIKRHIRGIHHH